MSDYIETDRMGTQVVSIQSLQETIRQQQAEIERLKGQRDRLLEGLADCKDDMVCWAQYASEYFQEKHDLNGDIMKYNALIAEIEAGK